MSIDYGRFDVLTFDCYGTLIDWEAGIVSGLRHALPGLDGVGDEALLEEYAAHEAAAERLPYRSYRQVLAESLRGVAARHARRLDEAAVAAFAESVGDWPAFPDAPEALQRLARRFRLAVITNCDDDLFAASNRRLGVDFDLVVTAQQVGAYKPSARPFEVALAAIAEPEERVLHVAQSLYHDHVTAKRLGLATVWIDRRRDRPGFGATPPAEAQPDAVFPDLRSFAAVATARSPG